MSFTTLWANPRAENPNQELKAERKSYLPVTLAEDEKLLYYENDLSSEAFQRHLQSILKADPSVIVRLEGAEKQPFSLVLQHIEFLKSLGFTRFELIHSFEDEAAR